MPYKEPEVRRTYVSWKGMILRCDPSKKPEQSKYYSEKGISVCSRWTRFSNFLEDMGLRPEGHFLDRKDNSLCYTPENCKWSTPKESTENRDNTVWVILAGLKLRVLEIAEIFNLKPSIIYDRLDRGWSPEQIVSIPKIPHGYSMHGPLNPHLNHLNSKQ